MKLFIATKENGKSNCQNFMRQIQKRKHVHVELLKICSFGGHKHVEQRSATAYESVARKVATGGSQ